MSCLAEPRDILVDGPILDLKFSPSPELWVEYSTWKANRERCGIVGSSSSYAQGPTNGAAFGAKISHAAWKTKPSWYVISTNDRMINPDFERDSRWRRSIANRISW